jgi:RNA polymerase sigma-70 factor, ECF subfamily
MTDAARGRAAVGPALEPYRARIERHVRSLVSDRSEAEDLTQETLLRAHEQLAALRDPGALGVWLYRIATRVCYDHLRKARLTGTGEVPSAGPDEERPEERVPAGGPDAEWLTDNAAMSACGEELLDTLPDPYRAVLLLHDMQGLTSVEIAKLLACTPGSVKIRLHRARQRFREALERECQLYRDERGVLLGCPKPRRS